MLIFLDKKSPGESKKNLLKFGEVVEFFTGSITYDTVSGHPDVFFHQGKSGLTIAPNLPEEYSWKLLESGIKLREGGQPAGDKYPESARYCAVSTGSFLICNPEIADQSIIDKTQEIISVRQGYVRCSLIPLKDNYFITSDGGVHRSLIKKGLHSLLVSSKGIVLPGCPNGFIGGTCGVAGKRIFFNGSLGNYPDGEITGSFLKWLGYEIIELNDGPLFDGGGILFAGEGT